MPLLFTFSNTLYIGLEVNAGKGTCVNKWMDSNTLEALANGHPRDM